MFFLSAANTPEVVVMVTTEMRNRSGSVVPFKPGRHTDMLRAVDMPYYRKGKDGAGERAFLILDEKAGASLDEYLRNRHA